MISNVFTHLRQHFEGKHQDKISKTHKRHQPQYFQILQIVKYNYTKTSTNLKMSGSNANTNKDKNQSQSSHPVGSQEASAHQGDNSTEQMGLTGGASAVGGNPQRGASAQLSSNPPGLDQSPPEASANNGGNSQGYSHSVGQVHGILKRKRARGQ